MSEEQLEWRIERLLAKNLSKPQRSVLERFDRDNIADGLAVKTRLTYLQQLVGFANHVKKDFRKVELSDVKGYFVHLRHLKRSESSVQSAAGSLHRHEPRVQGPRAHRPRGDLSPRLVGQPAEDALLPG